MSGGTPAHTSSQQTTDIPQWMQPYAQGYMGLSQQQYAPGGQLAVDPYPQQQVAGFNPSQQVAFDTNSYLNAPNLANIQGAQAFEGGVMQQPGIMGNALNMQNNLMGQNAMQNPLLNDYFNNAASGVMGQLNSSAVKSGAFGGSGAQGGAQDAMAKLASQIYTPAWNQQEQLRQQAANFGMGAQQQQQQAAYMTPYLAQSSYFPSQMLMQGGNQQQTQQQNILNTLFQNLSQQAGWPTEALQNLGQSIGLGLGTGGVTTFKGKTS